jgi:hypothetical protein
LVDDRRGSPGFRLCNEEFHLAFIVGLSRIHVLCLAKSSLRPVKVSVQVRRVVVNTFLLCNLIEWQARLDEFESVVGELNLVLQYVRPIRAFLNHAFELLVVKFRVYISDPTSVLFRVGLQLELPFGLLLHTRVNFERASLIVHCLTLWLDVARLLLIDGLNGLLRVLFIGIAAQILEFFLLLRALQTHRNSIWCLEEE